MPLREVLDADLNHKANKLRLTVRPGGRVRLDACKVRVFVDGFGGPVQAMTLERDLAVYEHILRPVYLSESSYRLRWAVVYGGKEFLQRDEWEVWPETVTIVTRTADGAQALAGVPLDCTVAGTTTRRVTNAAGEVVVRGMSVAWSKGLSVTFPSGWIGEEKRRARARIYHVRRAKVAAFVSPQASAEQWVNLAPDRAKPAYGHRASISVGIQDRLGAAGDAIFVKATFRPESQCRRSGPLLLGAEGVRAQTVEDARIEQGKIKLGDAGAKTVFEIDLGDSGGLTCTVAIGMSSACQDAALTLTSRRKLFIQVTRPSRLAPPRLTRAAAALALVGLELESYEVPSAVLDEATSDVPASAWVDRSILEADARGRALVVGDHNVAAFKAMFLKKAEGPALHIILCDRPLDARHLVYNAAGILVSAADVIEWPPGAAMRERVRGLRLDARQIGRREARFFAVDLTDGKAAVKDCAWRCPADPTKGGPIDPAQVVIDYPRLGNCVFIRLPDAAAALVDTGARVELSIKIAYALGDHDGWCTPGDHHLVLHGGMSEAEIEGAIVHACGQRITPRAPRSARYDEVQRDLPRSLCAAEVEAATYRDPPRRLDQSSAEETRACVLSSERASARCAALAFCDACSTRARAAPVHEITRPPG